MLFPVVYYVNSERVTMKDKIRLNIEGGSFIDFEVTRDTLEKLSRYCEKRFPEKNWKFV